MTLNFSDLVPDDDAPERDRTRAPKGSGPLSIYGFDDTEAPDPNPAPDPDPDPDPEATGEVPPAPRRPKPKRPASGIYGFEVDPDALSGELVDEAEAGAPPAGPLGFDLDPDQVAGELVAEAAREPEPTPEPAAAPPAARRPPTASDRPPPELLAEVAAALSDVDDGELEDPVSGVPEGSWLDAPAGPDAPERRPAPAEHKPTETVSAADARGRGSRAPAPAGAPPANDEREWGASTQEIAEELLKAVDAEKRGIDTATSEDDLQALLSAALDDGGAPLPKRGRTPDPVPAPDTVPDGDFRAIAAGLIADLEASINPDGAAEADQEA